MEPVVLGFDPSLTGSAFRLRTASDILGDGFSHKGFSVKTSIAKYAHRVARLDYLEQELVKVLADAEGLSPIAPRWLFIEGYSYGSRNKREELGEFGGVARLMAYQRGWNLVEVAPPTLKKYVTGNGTAEKDSIRMEVYKRWAYESTNNDDADAFSLLHLGIGYAQWRAYPDTELRTLQRGCGINGKDLLKMYQKLEVLRPQGWEPAMGKAA